MSVAAPGKFAPTGAGLHASVSTEGTAVVLALRGEADIATLPLVVEALGRVVTDSEGDVVVDLALTEFIDIATLRAVLAAREALRCSGRDLTLRSPTRLARRLLAVFDLSHLVVP